MAETAIAGVSGSMTYTGHGGRIMQFEITSVQDINDASGFGLTNNWRDNLAGMRGWRVRFSGYLLKDAAGTAPKQDFSATGDDVGITFTGTIASGCTEVGVVIPSSIVTGTGINGNATFAIEGVGKAALTETWDVT